MTRVVFEYDEETQKWEVTVEGLSDPIEVKQAFNAVLVTSREPLTCMEHKVAVIFDRPDSWKVTPAVRGQ